MHPTISATSSPTVSDADISAEILALRIAIDLAGTAEEADGYLPILFALYRQRDALREAAA